MGPPNRGSKDVGAIHQSGLSSDRHTYDAVNSKQLTGLPNEDDALAHTFNLSAKTLLFGKDPETFMLVHERIDASFDFINTY